MSEIDLSHDLISMHCPSCGMGFQRHASDLKQHPQVTCPECGCQFTLEKVDELIAAQEDFWMRVKNRQADS